MEIIRLKNDVELYEAYDKYIADNYEYVKTLGVSLLLKKDNKEVLLTFEDGNTLEDFGNKKMEVVYPDFNDTFLGVISAIRNNFGYEYTYPMNTKVFDKKYKKVIILLLDGMGVNILENNLDDNTYLRRKHELSIHAVYPSTTAAATTSIKSGLSPKTTGWTGWENYFPRINRNVILFNGTNYFTGEQTGVCGYTDFPTKPFWNDMKINGYVVEPDFSKKKHNIKDVLKRSLKINKKDEEQIQYVYFTDPDSTMHIKGAYSMDAKKSLAEINKRVERYAGELSSDTILIITADHGHTDVTPLMIAQNKHISALLERNPSNDARCITFKVKTGKNKEFEENFNKFYGNIYELYSKEYILEHEFIGLKKDLMHSNIDVFMADYVAVAVSSYYFNYNNETDIIFKSHHAGITKNEMIVPLCIERK